MLSPQLDLVLFCICVPSFRLCHRLWTLHLTGQMGEQLAATKLCGHWHRKLVILHRSVLLLSVRNLLYSNRTSGLFLFLLVDFFSQMLPQQHRLPCPSVTLTVRCEGQRSSAFSVGDILFCLGSFLELQFPQRSKFLRTGAFVLPFLFDSVPLFYRVSVGTSALAHRQTPSSICLLCFAEAAGLLCVRAANAVT